MSFERIHRSNLIGMGILPLRLPTGITPQSLHLQPGDRIGIKADAPSIVPRGRIPVSIVRANGQTQAFEAIAAVETQLEVLLLQHGG